VKIPAGDGYRVGYMDVEIEVPKGTYLFVGAGRTAPLDGGLISLPYSYYQIRDLFELGKYKEVVADIDIPGSSVKGSIRSILELSLEDACILYKDEPAAESKRWRKVLQRLGIDLRTRRKGPCGDCPVCKMFGYARSDRSEASSFEFSDFLGRGVRLGILELAHHRGLERLLAVMPENTFLGRISFVARDEEIGLLSTVMFDSEQLPLGFKRLRKENGIVFGRVVFRLGDLKFMEIERGPKFVDGDLGKLKRKAMESFGDRFRRYDFIRAIEEVNEFG